MITIHAFIYGFIAIVIGTLFVMYSYQIAGFTGRQDWIEKYLGAGSTYGAYKIFGIVIVLGGILGATGLLHGAATWLLSPLHSVFPQAKHS